MTSLRDRDPFDVRLARLAPGPLRAFNDAGVLSSADVHVARRLARIGGCEGDDAVLLALALAARAPRLGHVLVDLGTVRETVAVDTEEPIDLDALPWPDPATWREAVAACPLVGDADDRPLRLEGDALYLDRYWREERRVAEALTARAAAPAPADVDEAVLREGLARLDAAPAEPAVRGRLAVIAGGPGTGKTTMVARVVALLAEQEADPSKLLVALAAPTAKAAAQLRDTLHAEAEALDVAPPVRDVLRQAKASTLHRLLGPLPGTSSRFAHDAANRLPHDVVVVDETSMVSLTMMSRLLDAVRPDARLVLVGDPHQLSSVEAGAVLGDVVGARGLAANVVTLERVHRFGGAIATLADAIRRGDADAALAALSDGGEEVVWLPGDAAAEADLPLVREAATTTGRAVIEAARAGDAATALERLGAFRLLCAHRRGPHGVTTWTAAAERWLAPEIDAAGGRLRDYPGRPLLVTRNDYDLNLFNGDTGVVLADGDRLVAAFPDRAVQPGQLGSVETMYAMTVHKAQGSQFATAAVILPPPSSRILTRELLYTAVTRARARLIVAGTEASIRAAVGRPAVRASGLTARLGAV
jgi:exodeoxyribonuclease V alpha subunit